jgi:hypothetical protein
MGLKRRLFPLLSILLCVSGCQGGAGTLPVGTFINQRDTTQSLELKQDASQTSNVFIRASIESGANKYFGKTVGTYVLTTGQSRRTGKFLWAKSPGDRSVHEVWFNADDGTAWTLSVEGDGTLKGPGGIVWKPVRSGLK